MITNPEIIKEELMYKCKFPIMKYLTYKCYIPLMGFDGEHYYFYKNEKLKECLHKMPFWLNLFK
jgi:hypothetical protein